MKPYTGLHIASLLFALCVRQPVTAAGLASTKVTVRVDAPNPTIQLATTKEWYTLRSTSVSTYSGTTQFFRVSAPNYVTRIAVVEVPKQSSKWETPPIGLRKVTPPAKGEEQVASIGLGEMRNDVHVMVGLKQANGSWGKYQRLERGAPKLLSTPCMIRMSVEGFHTYELPALSLRKGDQVEIVFLADQAGESEAPPTPMLPGKAADIKKAEEAATHFGDLIGKGQGFLRAGKYSDASKCFKGASTLEVGKPNKALSLYLSAVCSEQQNPLGEYREPINDLYANAEKLDPQARAIWIRHELYLTQCGKTKEAQALWETMLTKDTVNKPEYSLSVQ